MSQADATHIRIPCQLGGVIRIDPDATVQPDPDWVAANITATHRREQEDEAEAAR